MIAILLITILSLLNNQGERIVSGQLFSYEENQPIEGATIILNNTSQGAVSDANGYFELDVEDGSSISIWNIGYTILTVELPTDDRKQRIGSTEFRWYGNPACGGPREIMPQAFRYCRISRSMWVEAIILS